ncbi:GNAT family N-acetyltransferase [Psychrosphaera sp. F3M07]|jgi:ribosomal protein S18 acetylase RimI-like enzyme|uniref:GNAT family N-acetyltransferase n=1 Tax=Psychrosphaera sp. F3M07 TaxID=2841560 RepID=UPI001C087176|nr:GNAT family N-acetyltransferase [Psychrosphaera sp. F3M07]MBU2919558.1 GNAT family N-acetyltransferase [Psychrosphaera sp. F3M07]
MSVEILQADYTNPQHAEDLVTLLNGYALDPMGGGQALSEYTQQNLVAALINTPNAVSVLCYVDGKPAGLINCFQGFSTFKCKPILNIHDVTVNSEFRGLGLSMKMMEKVESIAKERGVCKLTLEVLEGNVVAKNAYIKFGFAGYELDPEMGKAMFWEKVL